MKKAFAAISLALIIAACSPAPKTPAVGSPGLRTPTPFNRVSLRGDMGVRFEAATANLLTRQDRYTLDTYKASATGTPGAFWWDWPGDQIGRMLSVMHVAEGYGWTPAASLRKTVGGAVLPLQSPNGNFGPKNADPKDAKFISGNAFALRGLMDAYLDTGEPRYLEAARRLARYFEAAFDAWKDNGKGQLHEFYGHCIDGLVLLHEYGGDAWALDLAKKAAERTGRTAHAHHSLSMYRGVLELYRVTGDKKLLDHVDDYLRWLKEVRIATGGFPESIPEWNEDEGCALADDVVVNLMMYQATGRDAYLDDAENTLVNHFFMNQFHTGGFGHRAFASDIVGGKQWQGWGGQFGSENPGCCSLWGQWGLGQAGQYIVTRSGRAVDVNLYPEAVVDLPDLAGRIEIAGDFPRMRRADLTVRLDGPEAFAVRLRVPRWAEGATVTLNGKEYVRPTLDGRIVIDRKWRSGDRIGIVFKGGMRLVPWPKPDSETVAVFDGPLCLAISSADTNIDIVNRVLITADGKIALSPEGEPRALDGAGIMVTGFRPIAEDWLSPNLKSPNRLRILFRRQAL
jgi:rhamnogalacturonyl hydrolase YesR